MDAARRAGIFIDAPCGGKGHCGKCRVKVLSGLHEFAGTTLLTEEEMDAGIRLACLTTVEGDMEVTVEEITAVEDIMVEDITTGSRKQGMVVRALDIMEKGGIHIETNIKTVEVSLPVPSIDDNIPDLERLLMALGAALGTDKITYSIDIMKGLPQTLRENNYSVKVTLHRVGEEHRILNIGSDAVKSYGLSVDVGTTTVAACLVDLSTGQIEASANSGNLQMQYGADVINRIIFSGKNHGVSKLQQAIVEGTVNQLIARAVEQLDIAKENIVCSVFAGNTTMTHMLLGVSAEYLRLEPYIPAFGFARSIRARDIGLSINNNAPIYLLPNVASYVGGDIVAGVLAAGLWDTDENTLFIDLGTNGEIVLGNRDWMVTCACSAGPAFEGGEISCGMRAAAGAIDEVKIHRETLTPKIGVIGHKKPKGVCGSGIIDLISEMFLSNIIDRRGKIINSDVTDRIRFNPNVDCYEYVVAWGDETEDTRDIAINEIDIDNFLRAKGAVYSGIRTLLRCVGLDIMDIDRLIIAGGIGQNLNITNSVTLGLLPDIDHSKYEFIGNSSLTGAYACLVSEEAKQKVQDIAGLMTYIELSADPSYMEEFVGACFLPHTDLSLFPSLGA